MTRFLALGVIVSLLAIGSGRWLLGAQDSSAEEEAIVRAIVFDSIDIAPPSPSEADKIEFTITGHTPGSCNDPDTIEPFDTVLLEKRLLLTYTILRYPPPCLPLQMPFEIEQSTGPLVAGDYIAEVLLMEVDAPCDALPCPTTGQWNVERSFTVVAGITPGATTTPTATATPAPRCVAGDVNVDGAVNARDAQLLLQYAARLLAALPCPEGGDLNSDGLVDAMDAQIVLQRAAGFA